MGDVQFSTLAEKGLAELQALIGSARAILAQYANEDDVEVAVGGMDARRSNEDDVKPIDISSDAEGSPQRSRDPVLQAFTSARDRYLASSKNLRKIIKAIQEKKVLDSVKSEVTEDESEEVKAVRGRVEELRRRVQQRNQSIKLLADELITLLDDLNMVDNWTVHTQK